LPWSGRRRKKAAEIEAIIDNAEYTTVVNKSGYSYNRASFHIQNRAKQYLKLRMPEGARLWTADVAGVPVKPASMPGQNGSIVLIPLLKRSEEDISYFVSVYYGVKLPGGFKTLAPQLAEPLEIEVEETYVSVYLPERYAYSFDTNMDEVIESVKEVAKGQTILADAARISERLKTESEAAALERLADNLEKLNEALRGQAERAREAQKTADVQKSSVFQEQYLKNVVEIERLEAALSYNKAFTRQARKRQQEAQRQQQKLLGKFVTGTDPSRSRAGQYGQRWGQRGLDKYTEEQEKRLRSQMKQRDISKQKQAPARDSITWRLDDESREKGFEVEEDKKAQREWKKGEKRPVRYEPKPTSPRPDKPMEKPVSGKPEGELTPGDYSEISGTGEADYFRPARAAGVQPLRIDLPERGVSLHFKKLGKRAKLTLYPSSTTARVRWAYALRMLVALGFVAFCVWQGVSIFGRMSTGRAVLEGAVAVGLILLALGSTVVALVIAGAIGAYVAAKYQVWQRREKTVL
jgi:hypothetical protein